MRLTKRQRAVTFFLFIILLAIVVYAMYGEYDRPWNRYQEEFKRMQIKALESNIQRLMKEKAGTADSKEAERLGKELDMLRMRLANVRERDIKIQQNWIQGLDAVDRCVTCHQGVETPKFEDKPLPYRTHSGNYLKHHPADKFGCVICHDGQGPALTVKDAHGNVENWQKTLLKDSLVQSSCRKCHPYDDKLPRLVEFPEASELTRGRNLYLAKGCLGCHVASGFDRPERIGPMLDGIGEKANLGWIQTWLSKPKDYLPETIMPFFDLKENQVKALSAFLVSLKKGQSGMATKPGNAVKGKELVEEIGCLGCHKINRSGGDFAPDLSRVAEKIKNPSWLVRWLKEPTAYDPETEMPNLRLKDQQIADISAYLMTLKKKSYPAGVASFSTAEVKEGKKIFSTEGCTGCHKVKGLTYGFKRAPEHTGFADKRMEMFDFGTVKNIPRTRSDWTSTKLKDPKVFSTEKIKLKMPNFDLTPEERRSLTVFMLSMVKGAPPAAYQKAFWNMDDPFLKGIKVIEKFNCTGCHKIGLSAKEIELNDKIKDKAYWAAATYVLDDMRVKGKVIYAKGRELKDSETEELLRKYPEAEKQLFLRRWFLTGDHVDYLRDNGIRKIKAHGIGEGHIVGNYKDLNFAPPILHYEGIKVQPNWLYGFLKSPFPIRPLTKATMPTFAWKEGNINTLISFFEAKDGATPFFDTPELHSDEARTGEKIFKVCLQCHYFNQEPVKDREQFGKLKGPNLAEAKRRLRPGYIKRWVKYPDLVIPGTQMKNFFYDFLIDTRFEEIEDDETRVPDVPPHEKVDIMSRFLMNPFRNATVSGQR